MGEGEKGDAELALVLHGGGGGGGRGFELTILRVGDGRFNEHGYMRDLA